MSVKPKTGYRTPEKQQYRKDVWSNFTDAVKDVVEDTTGRLKIVIMPSTGMDEINLAFKHGLYEDDLICVDNDPDVIENSYWRKACPDIITFCGDVGDVPKFARENGWLIRAANLDLCGNFSEKSVVSFTNFVKNLSQYQDITISLTVAKGREERATVLLLNRLQETGALSAFGDARLSAMAYMADFPSFGKLTYGESGAYQNNKFPMAWGIFDYNAGIPAKFLAGANSYDIVITEKYTPIYGFASLLEPMKGKRPYDLLMFEDCFRRMAVNTSDYSPAMWELTDSYLKHYFYTKHNLKRNTSKQELSEEDRAWFDINLKYFRDGGVSISNETLILAASESLHGENEDGEPNHFCAYGDFGDVERDIVHWSTCIRYMHSFTESCAIHGIPYWHAMKLHDINMRCAAVEGYGWNRRFDNAVFNDAHSRDDVIMCVLISCSMEDGWPNINEINRMIRHETGIYKSGRGKERAIEMAEKIGIPYWRDQK